MADTDWDFPNLGVLWEYRNRAIVTGGERLDELGGTERESCLAALTTRTRSMVDDLDDGWLVASAFSMVEDIYKSFYRGFIWSPGVHDYLAATAGIVMQELHDRGFVLHYVVDLTDNPGNIAHLAVYLPQVFDAAGVAVVGPQIVAASLYLQEAGDLPADFTAIQRYRDEGHAIADEMVDRWHQERRSSVYLNVDFDDDSPGLPLDVAMSVAGDPGVIAIFRNQPPTEESTAAWRPPPGVVMPAGLSPGPST